MKFALAAVLTAVGLAVAGSSMAATTPQEAKYILKQQGFSIILPPKWYPVYRTVKGVENEIAAAKAEKIKGLATAYSFYLTAAGKQQLKDYVFQAFVDVYPSTDPLIPQIAVQISKPKAPYKASQLAAAGDTFASVLAQNKGAKVTKPQRISLPEGAAEYITASIPIEKNLTDAVEMFLMIHSGKLYVIKFDIDKASDTAGVVGVFKSIAVNVRFL